ncbi:MAG: GDSL-type esterase/lipase family protein [Flaviflexus sp.]|nr:GDSL-type esterase/lipase family protein [Flaviflexus sp.]
MNELAILIAAALLSGLQLNLVQIGDSYGSGLGGGAYEDRVCRRSPASALDFAAKHTGSSARNVACAGAHLSHLTRERRIHEQYHQVDLAGRIDLLEAAAHAAFFCDPGIAAPIATSIEIDNHRATVGCTATLPAQVDEVGGATDIFLTAGGNDVGFVDVAARCFALPDETGCQSALDRVRTEMDEVMVGEERAIRAVRANSDARIHVVTYPPVVSPDYTIGSYLAGREMTEAYEEWNARLAELVSGLDSELGGISLVDTGQFWDPEMIHRSGAIDELFHPTQEGHRAIGLAYLVDLLATVGEDAGREPGAGPAS